MANTSPWITSSKKNLDRIRESHAKIMDENKNVKFKELGYDLNDLFKNPPIFEIPPMRFN